MKPPPRDALAEKKICFTAKGIFVSLGLDNGKNRFKCVNGVLTVQGSLKIRSQRKARKAAPNNDALMQILEEQLKKIPKVTKVNLRLKGARKNNGKWTTSI